MSNDETNRANRNEAFAEVRAGVIERISEALGLRNDNPPRDHDHEKCILDAIHGLREEVEEWRATIPEAPPPSPSAPSVSLDLSIKNLSAVLWAAGYIEGCSDSLARAVEAGRKAVPEALDDEVKEEYDKVQAIVVNLREQTAALFEAVHKRFQ